MKTVASISGGWCVDTNLIQCTGHTLKVVPMDYGSCALEHRLPDLMDMRDVIHDMNRCPNDIYILPERDEANEHRT